MAHTRDDLRQGLTHVLNTFDQAGAYYAWQVVRKRYNIPESGDHLVSVVAQGSLESALVNLRALNDFFRPSLSNDDIRAIEYPGYRTPGPFLSDADVAAINKQLAHITWTRNEVFDGYYMRRNLEAAVERMLNFLAHLRSEHAHFTDPELPVMLALERRLQAVQEDALPG